jgi:hypothetical protein
VCVCVCVRGVNPFLALLPHWCSVWRKSHWNYHKNLYLLRLRGRCNGADRRPRKYLLSTP